MCNFTPRQPPTEDGPGVVDQLLLELQKPSNVPKFSEADNERDNRRQRYKTMYKLHKLHELHELQYTKVESNVQTTIVKLSS